MEMVDALLRKRLAFGETSYCIKGGWHLIYCFRFQARCPGPLGAPPSDCPSMPSELHMIHTLGFRVPAYNGPQRPLRNHFPPFKCVFFAL